MKQTSIDSLNAQLFETIEMLKNNNDPNASPHEKIDVEIAKTIGNIGKVIVEGYKTKVQALAVISNTANPDTIKKIMISDGFHTES
jgi:hypothetical protein